MKGNAKVDPSGLHFDGKSDYATIKSFHYADNATFSIAFWMTKVQCANGVYEYVYSHGQKAKASITDLSNSNVNVYIGCEKKQGGWSTLGGSAVRFNLVGSGGTWASWDYALHNAGNFDAITNKWMHVVLVVSPDRVLTYDDGKAVPDAQYGFFKYHSKKQKVANAAYPHPGSLKKAFKGFTLTQEIYLGGRSDLNKQRHFMGRLAGLLVSKQTLTAAQASCSVLPPCSLTFTCLRYALLVGQKLAKATVLTLSCCRLFAFSRAARISCRQHLARVPPISLTRFL